MHIVAIHDWPSDEAEVAKIIAEALGCGVFEARQKIAGGGPRLLASFSDPLQAGAFAARLSLMGVPALAIDVEDMRGGQQPLHVRRLAAQARYDDRLLQRAGQARMLGPALNPESHLDLACEILARTLR